MTRFLLFATLVLGGVGMTAASVSFPVLWLPAVVIDALVLLGLYDLLQRRHTILRNYPVIGHGRYLMEMLRPEIQQYFVESDTIGTPFSRDIRSLVYQHAKEGRNKKSFGTELNLMAPGSEWFAHSVFPRPVVMVPFRVRVGGPDCTQPYDMAMFNVSAMSFGSLSAPAVRALNMGAKLGGFAHDSGEGGLTPYHLDSGGDLVWEIGSGYFGCRTQDGAFDPGLFAEKAAHPHVKCVCLKLSQGAKPGLGGVMPAAKITAEIAAVRGIPLGVDCISPSSHSAFYGPLGLVRFLGKMRELAEGKPVGFKFCMGQPADFLAICAAMLETGIFPDFILVDGSEGGTGAAPLDFQDHVGFPLREGLMFVHNALVGCGIRGRIRVGASGKVASGFDIARCLAQGADYANSARSMMFALGCIQAQRCHTNHCPTGVATQDARRARGLDVASKSRRVHRFQAATVESFNALLAAMGLSHPSEISPNLLYRRVDEQTVATYAELYPWLEPGALLGDDAPTNWSSWWEAAQIMVATAV